MNKCMEIIFRDLELMYCQLKGSHWSKKAVMCCVLLPVNTQNSDFQFLSISLVLTSFGLFVRSGYCFSVTTVPLIGCL